MLQGSQRDYGTDVANEENMSLFRRMQGSQRDYGTDVANEKNMSLVTRKKERKGGKFLAFFTYCD